jgi:polyisoprenoid-binding protein YceI
MLQEVLHAGTHEVGPDNATLSVNTERGGAAAKAGHDLLIHVTSWRGRIVVGESPDDITLELSADPTSLRVQEGRGGMKELDDADLDNIHQTIDDEVLQRRDIAFRSTATAVDGDVVHVDGDLTLFGNTHPVSFDLRVGDDGAITGAATVRQTDWGMKPYSALFGALKVDDEVRVELDGNLASYS